MDTVHGWCLSPKNVTQKYVLGLSFVYVCGLWKAGVLWCIVEVVRGSFPFFVFVFGETFLLLIRMNIKDF